MKLLYIFVIITLLGSAASIPVIAAEQTAPAANGTEEPLPEKTTREDVRKEVRDAVDAIKSYSADKRDEAVKRAKSALDDFDARMDKLEQKAKEKQEKAVARLKERRKQVAKRYEEMKQATKEKWEKAKSRFLKSYQEMEEEYEEKVDPFLAKDETKDDASHATAEGK
jgi:hypothetical protein